MRRLRFLLVAAVLTVAGSQLASAAPPNECFAESTNDNRSTDGQDFLSGDFNQDIAALGEGADQYFAGPGPDLICGNEGDDLIVGEGGNDGLSGGEGDDHLIGGSGADALWGSSGADELRGGGGSDTLRPGGDAGVDLLYDGPGEDNIFGGEEDIWRRCDDGVTDPHEDFAGTILPDPDCEV